MSNLRQQVLQSFKRLHRTRMKVFAGDTKALTAARLKINEEYNKNKYVQDEDAIKAVCSICNTKLKMVKFGEDVEIELRSQVIQAREVKPGVFEAVISEDTLKLENKPFNDAAIPDISSSGSRPCCQDKVKNK